MIVRAAARLCLPAGILMVAAACAQSTSPPLCGPSPAVTVRPVFGGAAFAGDSLILMASVSDCPSAAEQLVWTSADPMVAAVKPREDKTAVVQALTPGTARIRAALRFAPEAVGEFVVLSGGTAEPSSPRIRSRSAPAQQLAAVVVLAAHQTDTLFVVIPPAACSIFLRVYREGAPPGTPLWDQEVWFRSRPGGCKLPLEGIRVVPASDAEVQGQWVSAQEILGDSLSPGRYLLSVRLHRGRALPVETPAGTFEIRP
jgi:hypothetical protein